MAHDANDLAPRVELLAAHVARGRFDHDETVPLGVEVEGTDGDPPRLLFAARHAAGDGGVFSGEERFAEDCGRHLDLGESEADEAAAPREHPPRGPVRVDDAILPVQEEDRHRRALEDGIEEELALEGLAALGAQDVAHPVEKRRELPDLVVAALGESEAEIVLLEPPDAVGNAAQRVARGPPRPGRAADGGGETRGGGEREAEGERQPQRDEDGEERRGEERGGERRSGQPALEAEASAHGLSPSGGARA